MKTCGTYLLQNDRLAVEIAKPGTAYTGSRFDWNGMITQAFLDKKHTFCMCEEPIPGIGTGGIGLCNEFGMNSPIGYDEAGIGGLFLKIGVGTLRRFNDKPNGPYNNYDIVEPCVRDIRQPSDTEITFRCINPTCAGYATELEKTIAINGNALNVHYLLKNTGEKAITTEEYMHNFIGIDGVPVGPSYRLKLAISPETKERGGALSIDGNQLTWNFTPHFAFYTRSENVERTDGHHWKLHEVISGCSIEENDSFAASSMAVWGLGHVVSAEAFFSIQLGAGESVQWDRGYVFND